MQYVISSNVISLKDAQIPRAELISVPTVKNADSLLVRGWYVPPVGERPIIMYFNGNEGSFSEQYERFRDIAKDGYGLLAFDYRGFGMSVGKVNEENILNDSVVMFDWVSEKGKPIVLFGRSLGTGPATYVASKRDALALVLETPFTAAVDVAAERYPFLPVSYIMKDKYLSREWMVKVDEPVFVGHGTKDKVIRVQHGKDLFAIAQNGKELWIVEGATHGDLWERGLWDRMKIFLESVAE